MLGRGCLSADVLERKGLLCLARDIAPKLAPRFASLGRSRVRRRDLLKAAAAATFTITGAPRVGRTDRGKSLVFVPTSDLTILDPVVTGARPTRNAAYLVFDTLYGINTEWKAQPQMVEGQTVEEDGLTWTLKLRGSLRFHDNEPVRARARDGKRWLRHPSRYLTCAIPSAAPIGSSAGRWHSY